MTAFIYRSTIVKVTHKDQVSILSHEMSDENWFETKTQISEANMVWLHEDQSTQEKFKR